MVNHYATRAGKQYETDLMKYLRERGEDVERLRLTGKEDEGDLVLKFRRDGMTWATIIEAKRTKSLDLAGWVKEAQRERENYDAHRRIVMPSSFVVIHKARGKGIGHSYVTTTLDEWLRDL